MSDVRRIDARMLHCSIWLWMSKLLAPSLYAQPYEPAQDHHPSTTSLPCSTSWWGAREGMDWNWKEQQNASGIEVCCILVLWVCCITIIGARQRLPRQNFGPHLALFTQTP